MVLITGVRERIFSPKEIACLPKKPDAIDPIKVVVIKNKKTPMPGIYISNKSKGLYLGGMIGITTLSNAARERLPCRDDAAVDDDALELDMARVHASDILKPS